LETDKVMQSESTGTVNFNVRISSNDIVPVKSTYTQQHN